MLSCQGLGPFVPCTLPPRPLVVRPPALPLGFGHVDAMLVDAPHVEGSRAVHLTIRGGGTPTTEVSTAHWARRCVYVCEGFGTVVPEVQGWLCPAQGRVEGVDDDGTVMMVTGCRGGREPRSAARPEEYHAGNDAMLVDTIRRPQRSELVPHPQRSESFRSAISSKPKAFRLQEGSS